uniref:RPN2_C domain-containing protein n=1 Tax=Caenorhabditis tropicalis TaxID=1561998 RepID=A0A1I7TYH7_9PELO
MGYKEGGAMFAYGLMHARHGDGFVMSALTHWLEMYDQVPILHGACLGFGVAGVGSGSRDGYMTLRKVLLREEPVSGEAAAISMGLILAGHLSNDVFHDLIQYSIETQHDKVQRGIRTGLACAAFGIGENVERYMPETLEEETNPILRSTGVCMLSMAYAGTGNPDAIRRLLDMVATDPNADVKRYAVIGIGFIMSKDVMTCLSYITILIEHYHPHVRYGATMAIAIACAGTGNMYAISLLEPMMSDREGYVRAGAFMAIAMIMGQQSNHTCPKLNSFRMRLMEKMIEEAEDTLVKVGVFIAQGLLDIGGQNASISMHNSEGKSDMAANVGMMCFIHGWYWHSMYYFISLAAKPSSLIILTPDLKMPAITITCHAAFDKFKYPPGFRQREEMPTTEMAHSILSIAVRNNKKEEQKAKQIAKTGVDSSEIPKKESSDAKTVETKPPEEKYHLLDNPTRVIEEQLSFISLTHPFLYKTARPLYKGGIIMATRHEEIKTEEQFIPDFANESSAIKNLSDVAAYRERKAHSTFPIALADY